MIQIRPPITNRATPQVGRPAMRSSQETCGGGRPAPGSARPIGPRQGRGGRSLRRHGPSRASRREVVGSLGQGVAQAGSMVDVVADRRRWRRNGRGPVRPRVSTRSARRSPPPTPCSGGGTADQRFRGDARRKQHGATSPLPTCVSPCVCVFGPIACADHSAHSPCRTTYTLSIADCTPLAQSEWFDSRPPCLVSRVPPVGGPIHAPTPPFLLQLPFPRWLLFGTYSPTCRAAAPDGGLFLVLPARTPSGGDHP